MDPEKLPQVHAAGPPESIPVHTCRVYLMRQEDGKVRARVASLAGLETVADDERSALRNLVTRCKSYLVEQQSKAEEPEWLDPPLVRQAEETERWIPVHL